MTPARYRWVEFFGVATVFCLLIIAQRELWLSFRLVCDHDSMRLYPIFANFADSIQRGVVPLWDPYLETGQPFFIVSPGMAACWAPWTLLLILLGKCLKIGLLYLFHAHLLIHFILFAGGSYALFRRLFDEPIAAFSAFSVLALSSLNSSYFVQLSYAVNYALAPWIMLGIIELFENAAPRSLILVAWLLGIAAGSYHVLTMSVFLAVFIAAIVMSKTAGIEKLRTLLNHKGTLLLAGLVFLLLASRAISEAWYLKDCVLILRQEVKDGDASRWADFATLVSPYFFALCRELQSSDMSLIGSMGALYIGLLPLWIGLIGMVYSNNRFKKAFLITAGATMVLMLGPNTPAYAALRLLPVFKVIRNTVDFHVFFMLCLCFFAGCGIETIVQRAKQALPAPHFNGIGIGAALAFISLGVAAATRMGMAVPMGNQVGLATSAQYDWRFSCAAVLWFILGAALIGWTLKRRRLWALWLALVVFTLPDALFAGQIFLNLWTQDRSSILPQVPQNALAADRYLDRRLATIPSSHLFNVPTLLRQFTAYHYHASSGTHFVELKDSRDLSSLSSSGGLDVAAGVSAGKLRLVRQAVVMAHDHILHAMQQVPSKDFLNFIFIEEDLPPEFKSLQAPSAKAPRAPPAPGRVEVAAFEANRISLAVDAPADCLLYYSDAYADSWRAYVDGSQRKIFRANYNFKAVPLSKGRHLVRFDYVPCLYLWALGLYWVGVIAGALFLFA